MFLNNGGSPGHSSPYESLSSAAELVTFLRRGEGSDSQARMEGSKPQLFGLVDSLLVPVQKNESW